MRDVDDGHAAPPEIGDQAEQRLHGIAEQRAGGLIHEDQPRAHAQGAGDGHQLHLSDAQRGELRARAAVESDLLQQRPAKPVQLLEIDELAGFELQRSDDDVFGDRQAGEQIQLLIDDADAEAPRIERTGYGNGPAVQENACAVRFD